MKHLNYFLFIAIFSFVFNPLTNAQELWLDEDFSSEAWSFALEEAGLMHPLAGTVVEIGSTYWTFPFKPGTYGAIEREQGFYLNGHWSGNWIENQQIGLDGRTITHSIRLRGNSPSYIELPRVTNAGKIAVYVRNSNANTNTIFNIEKLGEDNTTWTSLTTLTTPGSNSYPEGEFEHKLEFDVNSTTPIKLRIYKNSDRFLNIYKITLEKNQASGIKSNFTIQTSLHVQGKTMYINSAHDARSNIQLIDLSGRQVWNTHTAEKQVQLPASIQQGLYIVRMENQHGSLNQSVVIY